MHFTDLGLAEPLLRAVRDQGYDTPTPIQAQAIPAVLNGGDLLAGDKARRRAEVPDVRDQQRPVALPMCVSGKCLISPVSFERLAVFIAEPMPAQQTEVGRLTRLLQGQGFSLASQRPLRFSSVLLFEKSR